MNDRARNLILNAALSGHPQLRKQLHGETEQEGDCVLGILHLALHRNREEAIRCLEEHTWEEDYKCASWEEEFGLGSLELRTLLKENDLYHWDFLTIARKHESLGSTLKETD